METSEQSRQVIRFGIFELDLRSRELRRDGMKVRLLGQPIEILAMLVERPGELVTREEIQKRLWPSDTFVDFEHSLNAAIKRLREALGDDADNPRFVETLPRRGYRFIAPVEPLTPSPSPQGRGEPEVALASQPSPSGRGWPREAGTGEGVRIQRRWLVAATVAITAIVTALIALNVAGLRDRLLRTVGAIHESPLQIHSIAVLPLENLSHDPEQEYFADGMTEALTAELAKIGALRVISRTSSMQYKATKKPLTDIARELNVDAIVEGSVLRSAGKVRITAQLIHAATDRHLWAENYERDLGDVVTLQGEVARAIAQAVRIELTPLEQVQLSRTRAVNPAAYEAHLKGLYFCGQRTEEGLSKGIDYFHQALDKEPNFAVAYGGLAECYGMQGIYEIVSWRTAYPKAKSAALKALSMDGSLAEAHSSLGYVYSEFEWNWPRAESEYKRALQLNPSHAPTHAWYGELLTDMGRQEEGLAEVLRARAIDPLSLPRNTSLGKTLWLSRQYDRSLAQCLKTVEIHPESPFAHAILGLAYREKRLFDKAILESQKAVAISNRQPLYLAYLGQAYAVAGRTAEARTTLADLKAASNRRYVSAYSIASVYVALGDKNVALDYLERASDDRDSNLITLKVDPTMDPLRSDPRFQALLRRMNFPP